MFILTRSQCAGVGRVTKILQQQKTVRFIGGNQSGNAVAETREDFSDRDERPDILLLGWSIHDDRSSTIRMR